jgi:DUF438 domain-containing protein
MSEKPADEAKQKPADAAKQKPAAAKEKSTKAKEKPAAAKAKPVAAKEKPVAAKEKPAAAKEKPAEAKAEPAEVEEKPAGAEEKPTEAKAESAEAKEASVEAKAAPVEAKGKPLGKMTVKELREMAKEMPGISGVHGMKKEELIVAIQDAKGIKPPPVKKADATIAVLKKKIKALKVERQAALQAKDRKMATIYKRRISRLKKKTRRAAA